MTWMTKGLVLDLMAIAIDGMQKAFDRMNSEPDGNWPPEPAQEQAPAPSVEEAQKTVSQVMESPAENTEPAEPNPVPEPAPEPDLLDKAKIILRDIVQAEGQSWVVNDLFPQFGITNINDLDAGKLPMLIDKALQHQQKAAA